jgi:hypothetical protein
MVASVHIDVTQCERVSAAPRLKHYTASNILQLYAASVWLAFTLVHAVER